MPLISPQMSVPHTRKRLVEQKSKVVVSICKTIRLVPLIFTNSEGRRSSSSGSTLNITFKKISSNGLIF